MERDYVLPAGERLHYELRNVRFAQVQGVWVPMEADIVNTRAGAALRSVNGTTRNHVQRTQFLLNPDHTALRSFLPTDIPDGTQVHFARDKDQRRFAASERCVWRNGKVLDPEGTMVFDTGVEE